MAWTKEQNQFAEYAICTVESRCDYAACNLNDAITVGVAQWWGTRAAGIIQRLKDEAPDSYAKLSDRLKSQLDAVGADDGSWESFYLENADADSWAASAQDDANHKVQDAQFMDDLEDYKNTLAGWGVNVDEVKQTIMWVSAYHQSPREMLAALNTIGGSGRSLEDVRDAILNNGVLSAYPNRYNEIYDLLANWDGTSAPPDFGQSDYTPGTNQDTRPTLSSNVRFIEAVSGQDLLVHGSMNTGDSLLCRYNGNSTWYPVRNSASPNAPSSGQSAPGTLASTEEAKKAMNWMRERENRFAYAQAPGRLDPDSSGYTDCSACIWCAINMPNDYKYTWIGTSTYTQWDTIPYVFTAENQVLDTSQMKPGDVLLMQSNQGWEHAAMYMDDGSIWGAGSAPCPKQEIPAENVETAYQTWGDIYHLEVHRWVE